MKKVIVLALSTTLLTACGGGGGGGSSSGGGALSSSSSNPGGIWLGDAIVNGQEFNLLSLVDETGEAMWSIVGQEGIDVFKCNMNVIGSQYTCNAGNGITIQGTFNRRNNLTGSFKVNNIEVGTFDTEYDADTYERRSSLEAVSHVWFTNFETYTETLTVHEDGSITGSDTNGCTFNGEIEVIDARYNIYDTTLTVSNCTNSPITVSGKSSLLLPTTPEVSLLSLLNNESGNLKVSNLNR